MEEISLREGGKLGSLQKLCGSKALVLSGSFGFHIMLLCRMIFQITLNVNLFVKIVIPEYSGISTEGDSLTGHE